MFFTIAEEVEAVGSIPVGLLSLYNLLHQISSGVLPAQKIEDTSEVTKFDVELYETCQVHLSFL